MLLDGPAMLADAVAGFTLSVASEPSGAAIILDGNDTGVTTPAEIGNVSVAVHNVTVALDGYLPGINETVEGAAGETTAVHFDLTAEAESDVQLEPSFSADPTSGTVPLAVQFADESAGTPVEWFWDFGDGSVSTDQNPVHTYADAGTYTVNLTVTGANGTATAVREDYIEAAAPDEPMFSAFPALLGSPSSSAPTAAFSGTPTSGAVPLTVDFTDESTGSPMGWAWFFGDETYSGAWTCVNASSGWTGRSEHSSVALPDGSIVLMGGRDSNGARRNDAWRSADGGAMWTCVNASAGWAGRSGHSSVALPDGSIVLMGGKDSNLGHLTDTWRSADGGATWTCVNASAGWEARYGHTSVALPDGSIVLMGGYARTYMNDVWRSTDGGATWTCVNASAGWQARYRHTSVVMPDGSIVLMGGSSWRYMNDVWRSTDGGATWTCVNASAGWLTRYGHTSVALPDGSIVLMGGSNWRYMNDVWRSTDGGATWMQLPDAGWLVRADHTSVALPDGSIVLMGGEGDNYASLNDTWRLQPAGSTAQDPTHTYTEAGTYPVTLQAYNAGGYNASTVAGYITVFAVPVASFTANATRGAAPLAVQFNDISAGSPTSWLWTLGDGTTSTEQNPIHTYTTTGTYTVNLTVGNAAGTDTCFWTGFVTVTPPPPVAAFSGTPTSGAAPLNVTFTDASTGSPTGWAWFFGDETYSGAWTEVNASAEWEARSGHASVAMPDGSIVLMGGMAGSGYKNDVWRSTDGGTTWTCVNASAGWSGRYSPAAVVMPDGSIVLMGGYRSRTDLMNDVWRSDDGGAIWTCVNASAGWAARYMHSSVALPDGSIVLMGGKGVIDSYLDPLTDTWRSADGGATWACVNASAGWAARYGHTSVALPDGSIVLMGGRAGSGYKNDVWRSTDGGATWTCVNASAEWAARDGLASVALPDGSIVLMGGYYFHSSTPYFLNDVWRSADGGATWMQLPAVEWLARFDHAGVALPDGSIVVMGGSRFTASLNDVRRLQPAGSSEQYPSHVYTEAGTYPVTLQASNAGGYNASTAVDYITVFAAPVANFTANVTSGTAPLTVNFTDTSENSPISWLWTFGDGTTSTEQNPTHTYANAGTYTVNLTADNAGGTDTCSRTGFITVTPPPPPTAAFSGTPTSGTAPLAVQFTDASTGDPTGWAWFFGDEGYDEAWTEVNGSAGWTARYGHTSVALPDGSIVLAGGRVGSGDVKNDTWRSADNGVTWTEQNASSGWKIRYGHTCVALPDGSIVLMGGFDSSSNYMNDVWRSTDSGETWTCVNASPGWDKRSYAASVALPDGSIILAGGKAGSAYKNDVWRSADGGTTWTCVNASAGWAKRYMHTSVALPDGSIVVMGGRAGSSTYKNDVWRSTDSGETWTQLPDAGWSARSEHTGVALPDGSIVVMGGKTGSSTYKNDVWRSTDNGTTWTQLFDAGWAKRYDHTGVALVDGSIVLMGGYAGVAKNDVWQLQPAGSTDRSPSHTYTTPGAYSVTLQAYNACGYNASTVAGYITVLAPPVADFTVNVTSGTAPLVVQFNDTSTGGPTAWNWTFGDGSFSEEQNPVHTYASAGTYTVNLTVGNVAGTDTLSRTAYVRVMFPPTSVFSGTPTSGSAPLTVTFTDASTGGTPTGWAWFFGDETYGEPWTEQNASAGWSARYLHASVALPDGSIVFMGGYDDTNALNDTWRSTDNGATWTLVNASAGWTARYLHSSVALPDGSIVLMGGRDEVESLTNFNDTWWSTDNGATWTLVNASAGWTARSGHASVALPDGSIVLMGGFDSDYARRNDTWRSTDGGATWTCVNASSGWAARDGPSSSALPDGSILLMGGMDSNNVCRNDVWRSTDNGATWTCVNASAGWAARPGHASVALPDGSVVLMGGYDGTPLNDTWRSADGGATWTCVNVSSGWAARYMHSSVALPDGSVVLMGGYDGTNTLNDTWRFQPAGSSEQNPSHTYTAPGTYPVTLQASNTDGYNASTAVDYITVSASAPTANFTANVTSGAAPLAVQFNDTSAGSPTAWNWTFGDGSSSAEQNPIHTYANAGTYTVNLTAGNAGGTDTCSRTGFITVTPSPPTAAFSGTPTSGAVPLTVDFTDASTGDPTGWAWFFGDESYSEAWTCVNASSGWLARYYAASAALPDGSIVLMGGKDSNGARRNDVWRSTDGGTTWTCVNASAGWKARAYQSSVALPDGSIVLMGGRDSNYVPRNDVWRSTDGGATWTCVNASAGWAARYMHSSVALPDGSIVLMGGYASDCMNDVWRSTDGGATWTCVNASAGWPARDGLASVALPDGSIVLMGGFAGSYKNDVWRSTDGGATWTCVNASAGWTVRIDPASVALPDGSIVLMGGYAHGYESDVWRSTDGGATWMQLPDAGWPARAHQSSVALPDGSIVLMGGEDDNEDCLNDTWRLQPAGSTAQNPTHTYTEAGTYPVTLQAYNAWGYNASTAVDYITVTSPPLVVNFTYAPSEGNAPLTVQFNDTSAGNVTAWSWDFGDGNISAEQNPEHLYANAGTYTIALNASNAYGFNVSTVVDAVQVLEAPTAGFTYAPSEGNAPLAVQFNDTSIGNVTAWSWDFGDGNVSSEQNPEHLYANAGTYTISLNASNPYGFNVSMVADAVQVLPAPVAGFTYTPDEGNAPLTVQFNDTSAGNVTAWIWNFGDGNTSAEQNPVNVYANAGTYTVSLNASNTYGFNVSVIADAVWVLDTPAANFTYTPGEGNAPLTVQFNDTSIGNVTAWIWNFGDGNVSSEQNPAHTYAASGTYTVSLNASNAYGFNVSTVTDAVRMLPAPVAGFTLAPGEGNAPLTVQFNDTSVGNVTAWSWDFGDGNTSAEQNPSHIYADTGIYTVTLNASNAYGFNVSTVTNAISALPAPVANFTCTPNEGNVPLAVQFNDTSLGNVTAWSWDFGDGNTSTEQNPVHIYASAGTYTVSLNASNAYGFNVSTVADAVQVLEAPVVNFTYTPDEGNAPLTVQFNDTSAGNVTAWSWDFGDGNASAEQNPEHLYANAGTYTVSLNASNAYGFNVSVIVDAVWVLPAPVAGFTLAPGEGNAPLMVQFNDTSVGNVTAWIWNFGDGNTSAEQNPVHVYAAAGTYMVSLNASNAYGFNVSTVTDAVRVLDAPAANFTYTHPGGNAPLTVQFNDTSIGNVTVWSWDFGDGNTSAEQNPTHIYASAGTYTVSLNASNAYGFNVSTVADGIRVLSAPVAGFTFSPDEGNAPLTVQFNDTSIGNVTAWIWSFGDGNTSAEQNPVHTYAVAGTYTVTLNASNTYGFNISTFTDGVLVLPTPAANFTYTPGEGNAPLTVQFNDTSLGNVTAWFWDFGDGNVSSEQNPVHLYATAGTYTVSLNASNPYGFNVSTVTDAVRVLDAPAANFTYSPGEGNALLTVQFNDTSAGNVTAWAWDFGDGNTSAEQSPMHTYASAGTYTVSLNASNVYGFNASIVADAVRVLEAPAANFTFAPAEGNAPLTVQFNDTSMGNVTAWSWDFGDGNTSAEQNPVHVYANAGTYTVSLNTSNAYGFNVSTVADAVRVLPAPVAGFTLAPGEGNAPLTVQFNDTSSGNVTMWSWNFGDGNTSAEQNPSHIYADAGIYTVTLNASNAYGFNVSTVTNAISALPAPVANFTCTPNEGNVPLAVQFNNTSIGNVTVWAWDFGDGNTSTEQSPYHTYANAGTYTVTLNASNAYGFNISTAMDGIRVLSAPVAGFTYMPEEGNAPLTVQFNDTSLGDVTAWFWDFGDGNVSSEQNPVHTYAVAGTYTVSLNASSAYGFNVSTVTNAISALPAPAANFTCSPAEGNAPLSVQFNDTSAGNVTAWNWTFGDGNTSAEQNPVHVYANAGTYTVALNASNAYGFNVSTVVSAVQVLPAPVAGFMLTPPEGNAPLTVQFNDTSIGNVTAWSWDFGDGNTSTEVSPTHIYANAGTYTVSLNASNAYGFNVSTAMDGIWVLSAPAAGFTYAPSEGNAPLAVQFNDTSIGNVTAWTWDFGDGQTSTEQNPEHLYVDAGIYAVSLNASNAYGFNVSRVADAVRVLDAPAANFTYIPSEGNAPLTVQFNDTSSGNVTAWSWDFGDGNTATEQSPMHTYAVAGTYTVSLNASNVYGFNASIVADAVRVLPAPSAGFTFAPDEGNAPLAVQFNDTSTGNVTAWTWDFGDGNTSAERNPEHLYANAGTYTVSLNASNAYGFNVSTVVSAVQVLPAPVAGFMFTPPEGNAPLTVQFNDTSIGNVTAWSWDFGDGNTSTEQNPVHVYANAGTYTVSLNTSNAYGFNVSTITDAVQVLEAPVANFTYTPGEGNAPLTVQFNDASAGNVTAWSWDFGDGNVSSEQNPVHIYATAGTYTVSLNASNPYGFNVSTVTDAVRVLEAPTAGFTHAPSEGNAPLTVQFNDTSLGNVTAWSWDFGDGNTSAERNPAHVYANAGTYTVTLNASNAYGFNVSMVADAVQALPAPTANFTYSPDEGNAPLTVQFNDTSTGNVTAWHWDFGDGSTSTDTSPSHTYPLEGSYTVTLNVSNAYGWNNLTVPNAITVTPHSGGGGGSGGGSGVVTTSTATPTPTPTPTPAPVPVTEELATDADGTVLETLVIVASDTVGMLTIPGGVQALDAGGSHLQEITIEPTDPVNVTPEQNATVNGTSVFLLGRYAYRVEPEGATFNPPITLTFNIPRDEWATLDTANLSILWQNPASGAWESIPIASIDGNATHVWVTAEISHFSIYGLFTPETAPATPQTTPSTAALAEATPVATTGQIPYLAIAIVVVLIVAGAALYAWKQKKQ